jgi:ribosomal protein S12 methylthiotransferase accessory factor
MDAIEITFPGGKVVDARVGPFVVRTDQPTAAGGGGSAPAPFDLFLAAIGTCAGLYVLSFCQARGLATEGLSLRQEVDLDPETKLPTVMRLLLTLPPGFPAKYETAIVRAAESCKVKKTIAAAPAILVTIATPREAPQPSA